MNDQSLGGEQGIRSSLSQILINASLFPKKQATGGQEYNKAIGIYTNTIEA
jgi:hypothetical protein